jgi:hypothetical protein
VEARRGSAAWKRGVEARRNVVSWTGIVISFIKAGRCSERSRREQKTGRTNISKNSITRRQEFVKRFLRTKHCKYFADWSHKK